MTADRWAGRCNGCGREVARVGCQCPKPGLGGAELLRRTARRIRHDVEFEQEYGDPAFLLAVADFLDLIAERWEEWQPPPEVAADWKQAQRALAVARAYLGESS